MEIETTQVQEMAEQEQEQVRLDQENEVVGQEPVAEVQVQEPAEPVAEVQEPAAQEPAEPTQAELLAKLRELQAQLAASKAPPNEPKELSDEEAFLMVPKPGPTLVPAGGKPAKNHVDSKPGTSRYKLLSKSLASWGKVPAQQAAIADILAKHFEPGVEVPESDLFAKLVECRDNYPSLKQSKQSVTYLFRYYRGLKHEGNHCGFIGRNFLQKVA